jgi:hypothetical protein
MQRLGRKIKEMLKLIFRKIFLIPKEKFIKSFITGTSDVHAINLLKNGLEL